MMVDLTNRQPSDGDDTWLRQFSWPEEYIIGHHPQARNGYYRWFASPNVIDLVRVRRQRAKQLDRTVSKKS